MAESQLKGKWINAARAAEILNKNSGREDIKPDYVRMLAYKGLIRSRPYDKRTKEYYEPDIKGYKVRRKGASQKEEDDPEPGRAIA